jgi:hypothetical protein
MAVRERTVMIVVKPMTWTRGISIVFAASFLALLACSTEGEHPAQPLGIDEPGTSPVFVPLPDAMRLAGGTQCLEKTVRPDKRTKFNVGFAGLVFPEGCVEEAVDVEVCVDRMYYAVDLRPGGTVFLLPVTVSFRLDAEDLSGEDPARLAVALVLPGGGLEIIPHSLDVEKNRATVTFSIRHFSRYALVLD